MTFEHLVGASYLVSLLAADAPRGLDSGVTTRVQFQHRWSGNVLDDVVVTSSDAGRTSRLAIQVKHDLAFTESDGTFKQVVRDCWDTFTGASGWDFHRGSDRLGIAVGTFHAKLEHLRILTDWARACLSAAEFIQKAELGRFSSAEKREYLATFRRATSEAKGSAVTDEELWRFLGSLVLVHYDIERAGASDSTYAWNRLMDLMPERNAGSARAAFSQMVAMVGELARDAGSIDRARLRQRLQGSVKLKDEQDFARDLALLRQHSERCLARIRDSIGGKVRLPRETAVRSISEAIRDHAVTVVTGEPMVGKSVLLHLVARSLASEGHVIALAAEELRGTSTASYLHELNVTASLRDLLAAAGSAPLRCILIDGLEKVLGHDERVLVLKDLVRTVNAHNERLADDGVSPSYQWRILMTCRQREADAILSNLDLGRDASTRIGAPLLEDEEIGAVIEAVPTLAHVATEAHLGELLRRPLVLDLLAKPGVAQMQSGSTVRPSEAWLMQVFWRDIVRRGEGMRPGLGQPGAREQAMLGVARTAIGLESAEPDVDAMEGLLSDGLLNRNGARTGFVHDVYEDWTLCRLVADHATHVPEFLKERGEPPVLTDAVRLYALELLGDGHHLNEWKQLLVSLEKAKDLSPRWQQSVLLAPLHSPDAASILDSAADMLLEEEGRRLHQMLLWLRRSYTVPNEKVREWLPEVYDHYAPYLALPDRPRWLPALKFVLGRLDSVHDECIVEFAAMAQPWMSQSEGDATLRGDIAQAAIRLLAERYRSWYPRARLDHQELEQLRKDLTMAALWGADILPAEVSKFAKAYALRDDANDIHGFEDTLLEHAWIPMCKYLPEETVEIYTKLLCEDPDRGDMLNGGLALAMHKGMNGQADSKWFPPTYMNGPFLGLLRLHPENGLRLVHAVVNHSTTCWRTMVAQQFGMRPVPQSIEVAGTTRQVWGDASVYYWFRSLSNGQASVTSALMALEHWLSEVVKAEGDIPKLFEQVLDGTKSVAVVGVCASVALSNPGLCAAAALPILANAAFWHMDINRSVSDMAAPATLQAFAAMTLPGKEADARIMLAAAKEPHRQLDIRVLVPFVILGADAKARERLQAVLRAFPTVTCVFDESERVDTALAEARRRTHESWAAMAEPANYKSAQAEDGKTQYVFFQLPSELAERQEAESQLALLRQKLMSFPLWCAKYLDEGQKMSSFTLESATEYALELAKRDDPKHVPLSFLDDTEQVAMGLAAFAAVLVLKERDWMQKRDLREWCRNQLLIAATRPEPTRDSDYQGESRYSPGYRRSAARALPKLLESDSHDREVSQAVALLARHPNTEVRQFLYSALRPLWHNLPGRMVSYARDAIREARRRGVVRRYRALWPEPGVSYMWGKHPGLLKLRMHLKLRVELALSMWDTRPLGKLDVDAIDAHFLSPLLLCFHFGRDASAVEANREYRKLLANALSYTIGAFRHYARRDSHYNEWSHFLAWNQPLFKASASAVLWWDEAMSRPLGVRPKSLDKCPVIC
ncbi:MAG: ATP-binding protein [candidate division WOR-3 bacterium]|nr:ATP-binding protein [candidate division WOR-3 bacterium]